MEEVEIAEMQGSLRMMGYPVETFDNKTETFVSNPRKMYQANSHDGKYSFTHYKYTGATVINYHATSLISS